MHVETLQGKVLKEFQHTQSDPYALPKYQDTKPRNENKGHGASNTDITSDKSNQTALNT